MGGVRVRIRVPPVVGKIAIALLVIYLCIMLIGGFFGMILWAFIDVSNIGQFAFNFAIGLIGLTGLSYVERCEKEKETMLDKSS